MANFSFDVDGDGIALITWDMAGRSMNVIDVCRPWSRPSPVRPRSRASSSPPARRRSAPVPI